MKIPILLLCICLAFVSGEVAYGQQNVTSGTISGKIEDARGAVVNGANISATHVETKQQHTTTSDHEGRYRFPYLRTGAYDLRIDAEGFSTVTKQLTVSIGQSIDLPIKLDVAGVSAQVNIGPRCRSSRPCVHRSRKRSRQTRSTNYR